MNAGHNGENDQDQLVQYSGKTSDMTDFQVKVLNLFAATNLSAPQIAKTLGVNTGAVYKVRNAPWFPAALHIERERQLSEIGGVALSTVKELITDESAPPHIRLKASTWTLEALGHGARRQEERQAKETGKGKPLGEMTLQELQSFVSDAQESIRNLSAIEVNPPKEGD